MQVCSKQTTINREALGGHKGAAGRGCGGREGQPGMGEAASDDPAHAAYPISSVTSTETRDDGF